MGGSVSGARALVAVILFSVGLVGVGAAPAAAQAEEPAVVVTPDIVYDGQLVGMDISGFPSGWSGVVECAASILEPGVPGTSVCTIRQVVANGALPPSHVDWTVVSSFTTYDGSRVVNCRTEPCVAGLATISDPNDITSVIAQAHVPITFLPDFSVAPQRTLTDGATVTVEGAFVPTGTWSIAQCGRAVVDDPTPDQVAASCGPAVPVTVAEDGSFTAELTVHDPLTSRDGAAVPCGSTGCVVVLSSSDEPVVRNLRIAFGPPTFEVVPSSDIRETASVELTVAGAPDGTRVHQCALPIDPIPEASCDIGTTLTLDDSGSTVYYYRPQPVLYYGPREPEPTPIADCRAEACGLVLFDASGVQLVEPVPISFAPAPTVTLEPAEGLLDGQELTLVVEYLLPGNEYRVGRCAPGHGCGSTRGVFTDPDGRLETTVTAMQQFTDDYGAPIYCRANCRFYVLSPNGPSYGATYTMAEGELSVAPDSGLDDGQQVQVTGSELMPTYPGVPLGPWSTGGWALTQCDRAVLDQANLLGVFTHCSVAPPTRGVTIDGSTLDTTFDVQATITKILGGTSDCAAAPGACVAGLVRLEQDGSLSTHLVPVAFG